MGVLMDEVVRGENFIKLANHVLSYYDYRIPDPNVIKDGDIVYCDTRRLIDYKDYLIKRKNLIIITHNCIGGVLDEDGKPNHIDGEIHCVNSNLFDGCFKYWFAKNCYSKKENIIPIPIGMQNKRWDRMPGDSFREVFYITGCSLGKNIEPTKSAYLNIKISTTKDKRKLCWDECTNMSFVTSNKRENQNLPYNQFVEQMLDHKFIISPDGNGIDCHRHWESFHCNRIPVIKDKYPLYRLYKDFPVLWVDEWTDLIDLDLDKIYNEMKDNLNIKLLTQSYWNDLIMEKVNE
jgi:hypothetical protein